VLSVPLLGQAAGSGSLAECVQYGDGGSQWGPVEIASVILGNEPSVQVPVQVIDSTFATRPAACANADQSPSNAGFNGILGVGLFAQDCGVARRQSASIGIYYSCSGSVCIGTSVPIADQVQNPVSLLPQDNNGVIVQLPSISLGGAPSVAGHLLFGIGTRSNNVPSGAKTYVVDAAGELSTTLDGASYASFIDTGSNGLFFPIPSATLLPSCVSPDSSWFCPTSTVTLSATNTGFNSASDTFPFEIGNFVSLITSSNNVFVEIGGNAVPAGEFDWGLPFHFGRSVYVGLEGRASTLGQGPYFAY
jgi:hypothetical protein